MRQAAQSGYVLVTGMIFVLILAVIGVNAMQMTNLDYRMSVNVASKNQAFERAESGRSAIASVLAEHLANGQWGGVSIPGGLSVKDKDGDGLADNLAVNEAGESLASPVADATYAVDLDGDGDLSDPQDFSVDVAVFNLKAVNAPGNGIGQFSGTLGLGKGASAGGTHVFLQIRSDGVAANQARSTVIADFRHVNK